MESNQILKSVFGYSSFRSGQEDIINAVVDGKDVLVIMPTGGGKSICYQVPALMMPGVCIVVSPLIALMNDQVISLKQVGVSCAALHSNISGEEESEIRARLLENRIDLLYVSPERLGSQSFLAFVKQLQISFIAVDEAHCVSIWGNDFRPDYAALSSLKATFPNKFIIALTATADKATQDEIVSVLKLDKPLVHLSSFERTNIQISVRPGIDRKKAIIQFVKRRPEEAGIIYCLSRKDTQKVASDLQNVGIAADFYHAGMGASDRERVQKAFQEDKLQIVCATIAFGMGIDKSNIKWVIHYSMPKNIEGYYQEIGRAGRDGSQAIALMFYGWGDFLTYKRFIDQGEGNETFKFVQTAKLQRIWEYVSTADCRTNLVLNYFGEYRTEKCNHCDNCIRPPKKIDGKIHVQKAISAVIRSKEKLPLNLLIDVLRGSYRKEVQEGGYHQIKTFGAGRNQSFPEWKDYITQMIDKGLLRVDYTDRLRLKSTPLSLPAIKGNEPIMLKSFEVKDDHEVPKKVRPAKKSGSQLIEEELVNELKSWRLKVANDMEVPAYVVLTNKAIDEIAKSLPTTIFDLEEVEGIGQKRIENYGNDLLVIIQDYIRTQNHKKNLKGKTYLETLHLLKTGKSPNQIADERGLNVVTVYSHLVRLSEQGENVNLRDYVTDSEVQKVKEAYKASGESQELKAINELLDGSVDYGKIRMCLSILSKEGKEG